ncbi:hypothetical protein H6G65_15990 [Microcystis elabens FACHB-917]|nr:hypothetical protein [Microcystis elabens FACHB-917]
MKHLSFGIRDRIKRRLQKATDRYRVRRMLDFSAMNRIHNINKASLELVNEWISDEVWSDSVYQYGLPNEIRHIIDCDIGSSPTTDALLALSSMLTKPVSYLEIGVSVGKNFWQVLNYLSNSTLTGFDIEEINPVLRERLQYASRVEFPTFQESLKKTPSSLTRLSYPATQNQVHYLCGDIFDSRVWEQLKKQNYNLIFSDAFHSADALYIESAQIIKNDLIDSGTVIIMRDELHNDMELAFRGICKDLCAYRSHHKNVWFMASLKGWLGDNWEDHPIGFFISQRK